jgi:hypothetical protein
MYDMTIGSDKYFFTSTYLVPFRSIMTFPQANRGLKFFKRYFFSTMSYTHIQNNCLIKNRPTLVQIMPTQNTETARSIT